MSAIKSPFLIWFIRKDTFLSVLSVLAKEGTWKNPLPEAALGTGGRAVLQQLWALWPAPSPTSPALDTSVTTATVENLLRSTALLAGKNDLIFSSQGTTFLITTKSHPLIYLENEWLGNRPGKMYAGGYIGRRSALSSVWGGRTRALAPGGIYYICWGCHDRVPQTGWLKQHNFIFLWLWSQRIQDQDVYRVGFFIFFNFKKLKYRWSTVLCQFLLYSIVTQSYIYIYIYIHFFFSFIFCPVLSQETGYSFLCYAVGPHCLSILNGIVCIY